MPGSTTSTSATESRSPTTGSSTTTLRHLFPPSAKAAYTGLKALPDLELPLRRAHPRDPTKATTPNIPSTHLAVARKLRVSTISRQARKDAKLQIPSQRRIQPIDYNYVAGHLTDVITRQPRQHEQFHCMDRHRTARGAPARMTPGHRPVAPLDRPGSAHLTPLRKQHQQQSLPLSTSLAQLKWHAATYVRWPAREPSLSAHRH